MAEPASDRILEILEELFAELPARLRGSRERVSSGAAGALRSFADELGLVSRDDLDELELRVAQLEHRLKLLEEDRGTQGSPVAPSFGSRGPSLCALRRERGPGCARRRGAPERSWRLAVPCGRWWPAAIPGRIGASG